MTGHGVCTPTPNGVVVGLHASSRSFPPPPAPLRGVPRRPAGSGHPWPAGLSLSLEAASPRPPVCRHRALDYPHGMASGPPRARRAAAWAAATAFAGRPCGPPLDTPPLHAYPTRTMENLLTQLLALIGVVARWFLTTTLPILISGCLSFAPATRNALGDAQTVPVQHQEVHP